MSTLRDKLVDMLNQGTVCKYMFDADSLTITEEETIKFVVEMYGFQYKLVHRHGGENQGLDYYQVYEFTDEKSGFKQLVKFIGVYHSYIGAEYIGYDFVEAKEKKVIVYE